MEVIIPIEFEKYSKEINLLLKRINKSNKVEFEVIGKARNKDNFKELYVVYNGYMNDILCNINTFSEEKMIYKMYPHEFLLPSKRAQVFMVYTPNTDPLKLNNYYLDYDIKSRIEEKLNVLVKKYNLTNEYSNKNINLLDVEDSNISETKNLNENEINNVLSNTSILNFEENYTVKKKINYSNIKSNVEGIEKQANRTLIKILLNNISKNEIYKISNIHLSIENETEKKLITYKEDFLLKNNTYKIITFKVINDEIKGLDIKKSKVKIAIK